MSIIELGQLQTESRNPNSQNIDQVSTTELCQIINNEDAGIAAAVEKCIPTISTAIDALAERCRQGGRVIYVGAGTSGRLGVLDASEIPPTYSASNDQFIALIAGGDAALRYAQEGAEDDVGAAEDDLKALSLNGEIDSLVGIAASGRTPYVLSCLSYAKSLGCATAGIACSEPSAMGMEGNVDHMISIVTGPEVVTGSTRMKAGTATKLALNMLSTGIMIKLGKTYGNMMIDVKATNEKLQQRSRDIIRIVCDSDCPSTDEELDRLLAACGGSVKIAAASILLGTSIEDARKRLNSAGGILAEVLKSREDSNGISNGAKDHQDFVLCVDGGGSKCAAVMIGKSGQIGRGEAGQCNVTNVGFEAAMSAISLAIQRAVDSCPSTQGLLFQSIRFRKVWIGLAGYDRSNMAPRVKSFLSTLLNLEIGKALRVTNDIELLVASAAAQYQTDSVVVVLAGTGSVAMSYTRDGDHFKCTGRAGGWGPLLGDDGSGYDIGRQGLRIALRAADEINFRLKGANNGKEEDPVVERVFTHFGINYSQDSKTVDLLNIILLDSPGERLNQTSKTKRIAEVAKVVLDAMPTSTAAQSIIETASQSLLGMLRVLISHSDLDSRGSSLIMAGGLIQNETYQKLFLDQVASSGIIFDHVTAVDDPALITAQIIWREL